MWGWGSEEKEGTKSIKMVKISSMLGVGEREKRGGQQVLKCYLGP